MFRYLERLPLYSSVSFFISSFIVRVYYLYYNILFLVFIKLLKMDDSLQILNNVKRAKSVPALIMYESRRAAGNEQGVRGTVVDGSKEGI